MVAQDPVQAAARPHRHPRTPGVVVALHRRSAARPLEEVADGYCCYTPHHALDPLPVSIVGEGGDQVRALRDDFERRVKVAANSARRRDALLDRACFYLLWQSGLLRGEVKDMHLEDLDLPGRRLSVRRGKGMLDRTVYLTDSVVSTLQAYLAVRGSGPTEHVFLYRNQALCKDLIHGRLKACGERLGVPVYPHRLRHTCATQLLNAGCRITSIQRFLGTSGSTPP